MGRERKDQLAVILPVFLMVCLGFFLPLMTQKLSDLKLANEIVNIQSEQTEDTSSERTDLWETLERTGDMKRTVTLRNGEKLDKAGAEERAEQAVETLVHCGILESPGEGSWYVVPHLAVSVGDEEFRQVIWVCRRQEPVTEAGIGAESAAELGISQEPEADSYGYSVYSRGKMELYLDDETGYLLSFSIERQGGTDPEERSRTAECMKEFLNEYYPADGRGEFRYTESGDGHEYIYTMQDESGTEHHLKFYIMDQGTVVFNM